MNSVNIWRAGCVDDCGMTFSIIGHCEDSNMFGVAITTSSICVGARCPHVRAGVGAVATQNITNPALGPALLDQLALGKTAQQALDSITEGLKNAEYRQLTVIDSSGNTACHSGSEILGVNAQFSGDHCFAAGNLLQNPRVPEMMTRTFEGLRETHLAGRLLLSLKAGHEAGGEEGEVHSAALLVADRQSWPLVDLRVDWSDDNPILRLEALWHDYEPQMMDYLTRAINPARAPSYGVPGDL